MAMVMAHWREPSARSDKACMSSSMSLVAPCCPTRRTATCPSLAPTADRSAPRVPFLLRPSHLSLGSPSTHPSNAATHLSIHYPLSSLPRYSSDRLPHLLNPLSHTLARSLSAVRPSVTYVRLSRRLARAARLQEGRPMGNKPPELYYEILHVARDASPQGVRAAYRSLVRQWHPDKHPPESRPEAEARFKAITEAYEALLDQQENRAAFAACDGGTSRPADKDDRAGGGVDAALPAVSGRGRAARSEKAGDAPCTPAREEPVKKVYSACSNVGGGGRRAFAEFSSYVVRKAPPLERRVECTLEELCSGCNKEVRYTRDVVTKNGLITKKEVTQTVRVKPGMRKGATVTLEGAGDERPGCLTGDAVFVISEKRHKRFKRLGDDLVLRARVPLVSALTGWQLSFRLLGGDKFRYAFRDEVICPGYVKVVKGRGMPIAGGDKGAHGDLMVKFDVVFPENLTDEQRKGLAEILRGCE